VQSGYLYWYALVMIVGVIGLMTWQLWPFLGALLASVAHGSTVHRKKTTTWAC
jgi:hypothetical protein